MFNNIFYYFKWLLLFHLFFRTLKNGCSFFLEYKLSNDGKHLELIKKDLCHNHPVNELLYKMHYLERRLPEDVAKRAGELLNMHVNKKLLQSKLVEETGKTIFLKDLSNLSAKYKSETPSETFQKTVERLKNDYRCSVSILEENNILSAIFFQDEYMVASFNAFPDILFFDGTYKLLDIRFTCFIFLIEDGNGKATF